MFRDTNAWPPAPDGAEPPPRGPSPEQQRRERHIMIAVALFCLTMVFGPLAGSSLVDAAVAIVRSMLH